MSYVRLNECVSQWDDPVDVSQEGVKVFMFEKNEGGYTSYTLAFRDHQAYGNFMKMEGTLEFPNGQKVPAKDFREELMAHGKSYRLLVGNGALDLANKERQDRKTLDTLAAVIDRRLPNKIPSHLMRFTG